VKLYLDENLSPRIEDLLRTRGLDAVSAHEAGDTQLSDRAQLDYAVREGRALVTGDVGDFKPAEFVVIADAIHEAVRRYPDGAPGAVLFLARRVPE
jgi:predicted nuclease of predicted toxin-antitoxin system